MNSDPYSYDHNIKLSAEEHDLQRRRAMGENIPQRMFDEAKARTIAAARGATHCPPPALSGGFAPDFSGIIFEYAKIAVAYAAAGAVVGYAITKSKRSAIIGGVVGFAIPFAKEYIGAKIRQKNFS